MHHTCQPCWDGVALSVLDGMELHQLHHRIRTYSMLTGLQLLTAMLCQPCSVPCSSLQHTPT
jgi:hypothetical protein